MFLQSRPAAWGASPAAAAGISTAPGMASFSPKAKSSILMRQLWPYPNALLQNPSPEAQQLRFSGPTGSGSILSRPRYRSGALVRSPVFIDRLSHEPGAGRCHRFCGRLGSAKRVVSAGVQGQQLLIAVRGEHGARQGARERDAVKERCGEVPVSARTKGSFRHQTQKTFQTSQGTVFQDAKAIYFMVESLPRGNLKPTISNI